VVKKESSVQDDQSASKTKPIKEHYKGELAINQAQFLLKNKSHLEFSFNEIILEKFSIILDIKPVLIGMESQINIINRPNYKNIKRSNGQILIPIIYKAFNSNTQLYKTLSFDDDNLNKKLHSYSALLDDYLAFKILNSDSNFVEKYQFDETDRHVLKIFLKQAEGKSKFSNLTIDMSENTTTTAGVIERPFKIDDSNRTLKLENIKNDISYLKLTPILMGQTLNANTILQNDLFLKILFEKSDQSDTDSLSSVNSLIGVNTLDSKFEGTYLTDYEIICENYDIFNDQGEDSNDHHLHERKGSGKNGKKGSKTTYK